VPERQKRLYPGTIGLVALWLSALAVNASPEGPTLSSRLAGLVGGPSARALDAAVAAYEDAKRRGVIARRSLLTIIDYTRPSIEPRLWVLDLAVGRVLFHELVAHGRGSGENATRAFSNVPGSFMTSRGLFVTADPYLGQNGYSLRLHGLDVGVNDRAFERALVFHGASYVSQAVASRLGRLGRSLGCPAVRSQIARTLIDTIKGGTVVYAYGGP
jgi:L,D-transpeptidase catalytic domain